MPSSPIDHISAVTLAVFDMPESVAFYKTLGLDVAFGGPDAPFTTMRAGESVVTLGMPNGENATSSSRTHSGW
jgi:catechol 2,3-dioxygenase-like lactoylglutathione lyase family enzyme